MERTMESRFKLLGHPLHPMLIAFPLGLLATAVVFDIIRLVSGTAQWSAVAHYLIGAGVIGGLLAAVPGAVDWWAIPRNTRAKRVGLLHGVGNVLVVLLFAVSWFLRRPNPADPAVAAYIVSFVGFVLMLGTGWLGGELVDRLGVGVDPGAHLDAPSSLTGIGAGYRGPERRHHDVPLYAGLERRASHAR